MRFSTKARTPSAKSLVNETEKPAFLGLQLIGQAVFKGCVDQALGAGKGERRADRQTPGKFRDHALECLRLDNAIDQAQFLSVDRHPYAH